MKSIPRSVRTAIAVAGVSALVSVSASGAAAASPNLSGEEAAEGIQAVAIEPGRIQFVQLDTESADTAELWSLMLPVSAFPDPYVISDRSGQTAQRALGALAGVPRGSTLVPEECGAVAEVEEPVVARTATAYDDGSAVTLVLSHASGPLAEVDELLSDCRFMKSVDAAGRVSDISIDTVPPPVIAADETLAYTRTVSRADVTSSNRQLVLVAQIADYRVTAIAVQHEAGLPDSTLLHLLFSNAVERVASATER